MKKLLSLLLVLVMIFSASAVAFADDDVLRPGDKCAAVKTVQTLLKKLGYYSGSIDGVYGTAVTNAVKSFQKYNSLTVDGKVGSNTLAALNSADAVEAPVKDSTADATKVKSIQTRLKYLGYYTGTISGKYDKATIAAVKSFQKYNELKADGVVGSDTYTRLMSEAAIKAPVVEIKTTSDDVKHIQERLAKYGYYTGKVDGIYGTASIAAVKLFQKYNSLTVDGAVGAKTLAVLDSETAVSKEDGENKSNAATYPTLREGDTGTAVKTLQTLLNSKYGQSFTVDGNYSGAIVTYIRQLQEDNGLTVDGKVGSKTWSLILTGSVPSEEAPTVLRPGDKSSYVKTLQTNLTTLGFSVTADGTYGASTTSAVKAFQKKYGLTVDGKAGPNTLAKINELLQPQ